MVVSPAADFIFFDSSTRIVSWSTNDFTKVGTYNIEITGTILAARTWTKITSFNLVVTGSCSKSTETNSVTAGTSPSV